MQPLTTLAVAVFGFIATNIDDLVLLLLFFGQARDAAARRRVWAGQFLGFTALVAVSAAGYFAGRVLPEPWLGLLGLLPILLGVRALFERGDEDEDAPVGGGATVLTVAAVTVANGADNIGVYLPLFASQDPAELLATLAVFYALLVLWCLAAAAIVGQPWVAARLRRQGRLLVPVVLIAIGIYILVESGSHRLLVP